MQKIDIHVHATATRGPERLAGTSWALPDELRAMYDRIGVEKGLLLPIWAPEYNHDPITSRDAEQLAAARPETLGWWFCGVDPRMGGNSPDADLSYYLRWFRARGARGVGEITANLPFDDPRVRNL